eukprot:CAMPEP_0175059178 /NCGR_PEP_ID=MMETSP0052_2-20121109/12282_1 /TAXON_ID=51329 ORGANISM="Polytomella parva, Strain SAG 63-3" /NCGR_SAMPLE_ID=MMETSP0052_2 /ASSEMBLY_ACC=CAM_ASM_000194 /LENGTH=467 /DNA_ID=CAMNT_0016324687 /DNA_START=622 /DNA_END=2022 /DNA_ORIENTATION=+
MDDFYPPLSKEQLGALRQSIYRVFPTTGSNNALKREISLILLEDPDQRLRISHVEALLSVRLPQIGDVKHSVSLQNIVTDPVNKLYFNVDQNTVEMEWGMQLLRLNTSEFWGNINSLPNSTASQLRVSPFPSELSNKTNQSSLDSSPMGISGVLSIPPSTPTQSNLNSHTFPGTDLSSSPVSYNIPLPEVSSALRASFAAGSSSLFSTSAGKSSSLIPSPLPLSSASWGVSAGGGGSSNGAIIGSNPNNSSVVGNGVMMSSNSGNTTTNMVNSISNTIAVSNIHSVLMGSIGGGNGLNPVVGSLPECGSGGSSLGSSLRYGSLGTGSFFPTPTVDIPSKCSGGLRGGESLKCGDASNIWGVNVADVVGHNNHNNININNNNNISININNNSNHNTWSEKAFGSSWHSLIGCGSPEMEGLPRFGGIGMGRGLNSHTSNTSGGDGSSHDKNSVGNVASLGSNGFIGGGG